MANNRSGGKNICSFIFGWQAMKENGEENRKAPGGVNEIWRKYRQRNWRGHRRRLPAWRKRGVSIMAKERKCENENWHGISMKESVKEVSSKIA
jgi:hypothetical protein